MSPLSTAFGADSLALCTRGRRFALDSEEDEKNLSPWYAGMNKRQEEKSERLHQEQIQRYHQIHDLHAKKVDTATIARQVGSAEEPSITTCR